LKRKLKILSLLIPVFLIPAISGFTPAIEWTFVKITPISGAHKVSIDPYNNIIVADKHGNLAKYDSLGTEMYRYSPPKKGDITLVEAWRGVNIFIFFRELQEYNMLDRFLTSSTPNFRFNNETEDEEKNIGFARLATVASDNNIWVFDDESFSLKKYNTRLNNVMLHTPLDLILDPQFYDLRHIREYQNLVFISDKNSGILVFDNLGNYKSKIPYKNIDDFNFLGDEIYFLADGKLTLYNIYTSKERNLELPSQKKYSSVLLSDKRGYFFDQGIMEVFTCKE
jgi:hypothetical protein